MQAEGIQNFGTTLKLENTLTQYGISLYFQQVKELFYNELLYTLGNTPNSLRTQYAANTRHLMI